MHAVCMARSPSLDPQQAPDQKPAAMRDFYACYLLLSKHAQCRSRTYIGFTVNPQRRIRQHNGLIANGAWQTKKWRPWDMTLVLYGFPTQARAASLRPCERRKAHAPGSPPSSVLCQMASGPPCLGLAAHQASPTFPFKSPLTLIPSCTPGRPPPFPSQVQALQFEWAWQHPKKSKAVRGIVQKIGTRGCQGLKGKVRRAAGAAGSF